MARVGVRVRLDVSKIDKARLFRGAKGVYLDCTAFIDLDNKGQYGDNGMVTQDVSKEERDAGVRGAILGNVTVFYRDDQAPQQPANNQQHNQTQSPAPTFDDFDDEIPF